MLPENIARQLFAWRLKCIARFEQDPRGVQARQLTQLLRLAERTEWGKKYDYASIRSYSEFAARVPVQSYEDAKPDIQRMMRGEKGVLWPGTVRWFAKSSGTTDDKSKFIPVTNQSLQQCHFRGGMDCVATYLRHVRDSKLFCGKALILGGAHKAVPFNHHAKAGDLSSVLIERMNPIVNLYRTPSKKIVLTDEWEMKLETICRITARQRITNLSGVPSWFLVLIKQLLEYTGKQFLTEVWPDLEVFFHGGISFNPYKEQYKSLIPSERMRYMETYNASEGFFALQNDFSDPAMLLLLDYGIFFEFIPIEEVGSENPRVCPLEGIDVDRDYALVISCSNGLWRYLIGDTVRFTCKSPYKLIITGRTRHFINAFGEELMIDNAEKALLKATEATHSKVREYTAAPVYMSGNAKGRHQWLIEFAVPPESLELFATVLDDSLKALNSDYEAKRYKDLTLEMPEITIARPNLFYDWLKAKNKLGGQHKIPRLNNDRGIMDLLLTINNC
ncbi:MAG: GH3 auxin-responsive promoter family protein [Dysgonamonadaceae bacterium]|jgi:hypothetical protein|nr:GH3 auxin-responsive promoter family protein [Dysgonamonadaceae bacterium]